MIGILAWCDECDCFLVHLFTPPYLPSVEDDFKGYVYWFDEWGVNPYDAGNGNFNPEWN